jgi:16S rRNA U1498 N3-methylase RsmE
MAEERTRDKEELDKLHKKEAQMRSIIQSMREQGRGTAQPDIDEQLDDEGTESDYDDEYEDEEEEEDEEGSFEGEDELAAELSKPVFGPSPPPPVLVDRTNGSKAAVVNGVKH